MNSIKAFAAELLGTFTVVLVTCAAAMQAGPGSGGVAAQAMAAGLAVTVATYGLGHVSGGHFNPAVTAGLTAAGRFGGGNAVGYIIAQLLGAGAAALLLATAAGSAPAGAAPSGAWASLASAANSYGGARGFGVVEALAVEGVLTAVLVVILIGATSSRAPAGLGPLAVGLAVAVLYVVAIPVTNGSLNPARSTAPAVLTGGAPMAQLWVFWLAPIAGGIAGGAIGRWLDEER